MIEESAGLYMRQNPALFWVICFSASRMDGVDPVGVGGPCNAIVTVIVGRTYLISNNISDASTALAFKNARQIGI